MDQKNQKNQEKNLSELMEFDFDDILMDDIPEDAQEKAQPAAKKKTAPAASAKEERSHPALKQAPSQKEMKRAKRRRGLRITFDIATWVKDLAIAAVMVWILITFVAEPMQLTDSSMSPTLSSGEHFLLSKLVYRFTDPDRDDILAFEYENGSGEKVKAISRVIGVSGDTIQIDEQGKVTINGKTLSSSYFDGKTTYVPNQMTYPYTVPEGYYFLLSDNPASTTDSRFVSIGAVSKSDIIGRVFVCYWPRESWRAVG